MSSAYEKEKNEAVALARLAGAIMMHYYDIDYEKSEKEGAPAKAEAILTEVDIKLDKIIRTTLSELWPEDALLTEETEPESKWFENKRIWIVDPLDGTLGFVKKTGSFGVSIALIEDGRPVVGVLYAPVGDRLAYGTIDGNVRCNGQTVDLGGRGGLNKLIVSSNSYKKPDYQQASKLLGSPAELRMESVVVKVLELLEGNGELYMFTPQSKTQPSVPKFWDIAAADLLVNRAGGLATDFTGSEYAYNN